jgi:hypothetical protein
MGAELKVGAPGLLIPWGILKFERPPAIAPLGVAGVLCDGIPPVNGLLELELGSLLAKFGRPWGPARRLWPGGAPCLDKEKAFILACMSDVKPLALDGGGPGRRAALSGPRGAEEGDMLLGELSKELRSDGGLGDVVAKESVSVAVPADAVPLEGSADAVSVSLGSCAGTTGGLSCRGSSIVPDSATGLYSHYQEGI